MPLFWLCFASLTPLRRMAYEFFKWMHILSAILFSAFFYIHCNAVSLSSPPRSALSLTDSKPDLLSFSRPGTPKLAGAMRLQTLTG